MVLLPRYGSARACRDLEARSLRQLDAVLGCVFCAASASIPLRRQGTGPVTYAPWVLFVLACAYVHLRFGTRAPAAFAAHTMQGEMVELVVGLVAELAELAAAGLAAIRVS